MTAGHRQGKTWNGQPRLRWLPWMAVAWALAVSPGHAQFDLVDIAFSHDGQFLAALNARGSLTVFETASRSVVLQLEGEICGGSVAWKPDENLLAAATDQGEGADIWLLDPEKGWVRRITTHPARDVSPQWIEKGRSLVFVSWREGNADLFEMTLAGGEPARPFVQRPFDQWDPCARPDGKAVAYRTFENGKPEIWVKTEGKEPIRVGETGIPALRAETNPLTWDTASGALLYVERDENKAMLHGSIPATGKNQILLTRLDLFSTRWAPESGRLYLETERGLFCQTRKKLFSEDTPEGIEPVEPSCLRLGRVAVGIRDDQPLWAAVCEGRTVIFREGEAPPSFLCPDLESSLLLAERFYAQGQNHLAEALYTQLGEELTVPQEIVAMRLHHAAFLRRRGAILPALAELNRLADAEPPIANNLEITELQGAILLYELRDFTEARRLFTRLAAVASKDAWDTEGWGLALTFLDQYQQTLAPAFVEAHAALRRRDGAAALRAMRLLADQAPANLSVRNAIFDLLGDPYGGESVDQAPNPLTSGGHAVQALELLEKIETADRKSLPTDSGPPVASRSRKKTPDRAAADREMASRLRQKILEIQLDTRQYDKAVQTTLRVLQADGSQAIGLEDVLMQYLDMPNVDQPLQKSLSRVLLDDRVVERLEKMFDDSPEMLIQIHLAQIKKLLLEGALNAAGRLLTKLEKEIRGFPAEARIEEGAGRDRRLYDLFLGKYMELNRRWELAAQSYQTALQLAADYSPEDTDLAGGLLAARAEAELAQTLAGQTPALLKRFDEMQALLRSQGDSLLAPASQVEQQRAGARQLIQALSSEKPSPLDPFLFYHAGVCLARGDLPHAAVHFLDRALENNPPAALRAAILFEKVRIARIGDQFWEQSVILSDLESAVESDSVREALRLQSARALLRIGHFKEAAQMLRQLAETSHSRELRELAAFELEHVEPFDTEESSPEPEL